MANARKKPRNSQRSVPVAKSSSVSVVPVEGACPTVAPDHPQPDHGGQHEQAADQRVQEELHRRVLPARAAVGADQEVHRHQHDLEEHVEQEHVRSGEHPDHRELQGQQQREVGRYRAPGGVRVVPRGQDHQRDQHRDQRQHHQRDAVHLEGEPGPPERDPAVGLVELEPRPTRRELEVHDPGEHQHRQRPAQRQLLGQRRPGPRHHRDSGRTDQRREREHAQVWEVGHQFSSPVSRTRSALIGTELVESFIRGSRFIRASPPAGRPPRRGRRRAWTGRRCGRIRSAPGAAGSTRRPLRRPAR